jgi:hypothetical protein
MVRSREGRNLEKRARCWRRNKNERERRMRERKMKKGLIEGVYEEERQPGVDPGEGQSWPLPPPQFIKFFYTYS